jgi:hypothetical protein
MAPEIGNSALNRKTTVCPLPDQRGKSVMALALRACVFPAASPGFPRRVPGFSPARPRVFPVRIGPASSE